jgi:hypothetical protein
MTQGASCVCSSLASWVESVYPHESMPARQPMHRANILCLLDNTLVSKNCLKPPAIELDEVKAARFHNFAVTAFAGLGFTG